MTKSEILAELQARRLVGGLMANVCFNLALVGDVSARDCEVMRELRDKWDEIPRVKLPVKTKRAKGATK
jgi:hypothetical protein